MATSRKLLTAEGLRARALELGRQRGQGSCVELKFKVIPFVLGLRSDSGANWSVVSMECPPECVAFWTSILDELAQSCDVDF